MAFPRNACRRPSLRDVFAFWMFSFAFAIAIMTAGSVSTAQEAHSPSALGWLTVEHSASGVLIVGHALGLTKGDVDASMTISRSGKAGTTHTTQSSHVSLEPGATAALSRTALSFAPGDRLTVELKLSSNGRTISTSRIETGG